MLLLIHLYSTDPQIHGMILDSTSSKEKTVMGIVIAKVYVQKRLNVKVWDVFGSPSGNLS